LAGFELCTVHKSTRSREMVARLTSSAPAIFFHRVLRRAGCPDLSHPLPMRL
jgi:hypothetical protein